MTDLWNHEKPIKSYAGCAEIDIPFWIDQDISPSTVEAILQGGGASGAYMPAVTYSLAVTIMGEYGDEALQYIQDHLGELPKPSNDESWSGMAVFFLSYAVELWASAVKGELDTILGA